MAYRDRTALFLRYRAEARKLHSRPIPPSSPPSVGRTTSDDPPSDANDALLGSAPAPNIAGTHAQLKHDVRAARALLRELRDEYAVHLLPRFGSDERGSAQENAVREKAHALTARLHAAQARVRSIGVDSGTSTTKGTASAADSLQRNLQRRFAAELQEISREARARQKDYLETLQRQRDTLDDDARRATFALDDDDDDLPLEQAAQVHGERVALAEAQRREAELRAVSSSIAELATLVKDLAGLVVDQGTLLDRIDYNLEDTKEHTDMAVRQLRKADAHQRKRQAFCVIILLAIACGIMSIMLVIKWTAKR